MIHSGYVAICDNCGYMLYTKHFVQVKRMAEIDKWLNTSERTLCGTCLMSEPWLAYGEKISEETLPN